MDQGGVRFEDGHEQRDLQDHLRVVRALTEQHTYVAILATPCSVADVVAGDILWAATKGTLATALILVVTACFGLLPSRMALGLLPIGFLVGLMFAGIGMVVTARSPSYDYFSYYLPFVSMMFLFAGVFSPLDGLPGWAQGLAWVLPLTHAGRICESPRCVRIRRITAGSSIVASTTIRPPPPAGGPWGRPCHVGARPTSGESVKFPGNPDYGPTSSAELTAAERW